MDAYLKPFSFIHQQTTWKVNVEIHYSFHIKDRIEERHYTQINLALSLKCMNAAWILGYHRASLLIGHSAVHRRTI